jgi:type IV fimbrial biogenesis protein FimT
MKKRYSGFTLIELMVVMTIVGILAAVAAPTFRSIMDKNRVSAAASSLQVSLSLARSEAIRRGSDATVYIFANSAAGDWSGGWTVFWAKSTPATPHVAPTSDTAGSLGRIEIVPPQNNMVTAVTSTLSTIPDYFLFNGDGRLVTTSGALANRTISFQSGTSDKYCVILGSSGRARVASVSSGGTCVTE